MAEAELASPPEVASVSLQEDFDTKLNRNKWVFKLGLLVHLAGISFPAG